MRVGHYRNANRVRSVDKRVPRHSSRHDLIPSQPAGNDTVKAGEAARAGGVWLNRAGREQNRGRP